MIRKVQWKIARTLHGIDSMIDYRWPRLRRIYLNLYPSEYCKEAPSWALGNPWWPKKR